MLVIDISINREKYIEEVGIVRIDDSGKTPKNDDVFTYKYGFVVDGKVQNYLGEVQHRYGDQGLKLSVTVLNKIQESDTPEDAETRREFREYLENERTSKLLDEFKERSVN